MNLEDHWEGVTSKNGYVLFWGGWPSQWHPSNFEIEKVRYNCAEQYMMAEKARLFGDQSSLKKIMASRSPKDQKQFGRNVAGFVEQKWTSVCRDVVYRGNLAKFFQNEDLRQILLSTGTTTIVEASPHDKIWGIGLDRHDPDAMRPSKWKGKNWLGEAIMRVRAELRAKPSVI
jgi:hypothetical protein